MDISLHPLKNIICNTSVACQYKLLCFALLLQKQKQNKQKTTSKITACQRIFHFMLTVAAPVSKNGSAFCRKDLVQWEHLFWKGVKETPLICTKPVRPQT